MSIATFVRALWRWLRHHPQEQPAEKPVTASRRDKEARVQKKDGKVFRTHNLDVQQRYLSPNYRWITGDGQLSSTGLLVLFKLEPTIPGAPAFVARWDGGSRDPRKNERRDLDIDIVGVSAAESRRFKRESKRTSARNSEQKSDGYSGHHTERVPGEHHSFEVAISTPSEKVFEGLVAFSVEREMEISATVGVQASLTMQVIRARPES